MLLVRNIRLPLSCPDPEAEAQRRARKLLGLPPSRTVEGGIARLSVDARRGTPRARVHRRHHAQRRG